MASRARQLVIELIGKADLSAASRAVEQGTKSISDKLSSVGRSMQRTGTVMTAAVTLPVVAGFNRMIAAASDQAESMSKVDAVFGTSAAAIQAWSETAAQSFGQSRQQALEAVGTFGNLLTASGFTAGAAEEMSTNFVELASDLASFNNIEVAEALEKLRAGLVGEAEPLRTLGVQLSAARIEAKATELGLLDMSGALSTQAKMQAAYAIILEDTSTAQGDFARTSEGMANSTRIAEAKAADLSAQLGQKLLPIKLKMVEVLSGLINGLSAMGDGTQTVILSSVALAAALGPVIAGVGSIIRLLGALPALFVKVGAAMTALMAHPLIAALAIGGAIIVGLVLLERKFGIVSGAVKALGRVFGSLWQGVKAGLNAVIALIERGVNLWLTPMRKLSRIPVIGAAIPDIPEISIPRLAMGGEIMRSGLALVHQGERVVPAAKVSRDGGGASIINIHVAGSVVTERDLIRAVRDGLARERRIA